MESTRKRVPEAIDGALKAVIVPTGSTEQHNEHLAMINDTTSVTLVLNRRPCSSTLGDAADAGANRHFAALMDRKGTLSLKRRPFSRLCSRFARAFGPMVSPQFCVEWSRRKRCAAVESVPEFARKLGISDRDQLLLGRLHARDHQTIHAKRGKAPGQREKFETSFAMAAFPQRVHWEGVDYARIGPLLHIKDPASAAQEEEFAREAKLATTAKGEAMVGIAVKWTAERLRQLATSVGTGTHVLREALNWSLSLDRRTIWTQLTVGC